MKMNNTEAVTDAARRALQNVVPTADELTHHAEQDRLPHAAVLLAAARIIAAEAADNFEPLAGQPIDADVREKLTRAFAVAMHDHLPPLANLKRA